MYPHPIHFELSTNERDIFILFPNDFLGVRQTANALDFLYRSNGSTRVISVTGSMLGILRRDVLNEAITVIRQGPHGPRWAGCRIDRIYERYGWTAATLGLGPDANSLPGQFMQFETGVTRDVWFFGQLSAVAVPRDHNRNQILFQFMNRHAYLLDTLPGAFSAVLAEMRRDNFQMGTKNRFSIFTTNPFPAVAKVDWNRYTFAKITYEEKNLAARGEWNILLDFRPAAPALGMSISI